MNEQKPRPVSRLLNPITLMMLAGALFAAPAESQGGPLQDAVDSPGAGTIPDGTTKHYYGVTGFVIQVTDDGGPELIHTPNPVGTGATVVSISCPNGCTRSDAFVWGIGVAGASAVDAAGPPIEYHLEDGFHRAELQLAVEAAVGACADPETDQPVPDCIQVEGILAAHLALVWPCHAPMWC